MFYYAKNVVWGELEMDDTVAVSFNIFDDQNTMIATNITVKGTTDQIQQLVSDRVKTKSAAVEAYNALKLNEEFAIDMSG